MSGAQAVQDDAPQNEEVERVARANGWKPKEQFKGNPDDWADAATFVARGLENPAILAKQNKILTDRFDHLQRVHADTTRDFQTKLDEAVGTVTQMTTMMRTSEQRAFDRARAALKAEQTKAVETGDTATFQRLDHDLDELDKTKPVDPPPKQATTTTTQTRPAPVAPEVQDFFDANPWYGYAGNANPDIEMTAFADGMHATIRNRPGISAKEALDYVADQVRKAFPAKFGIQARTGGNGRQPVTEDDDERNDDSPVVLPSSGGTPRPRPGRFTFDAMPKDSKDAFGRYVKMLAGKGDPLTKDEWATSYWEQYKDNGA